MTEERPQIPVDPFEEQGADPHFDLRRGLVVLITVIAVMVVITLICVWLADWQSM